MILSMTGYGKSSCIINNYKITIEIKSLNSKLIDIYTKIPIRYRSKELEFRKIINDKLNRGKIDIVISLEDMHVGVNNHLNKDLILSYIKELKSIDSSGDEMEYLGMAVRMPEVFATEENEVSEEEWKIIFNCLDEALENLKHFRLTEGNSLEKGLSILVNNIKNYLSKVPVYEEERLVKIKNKLENQLAELEVKVDPQRYHQELIYYIEKLDISEEKLRLEQHCNYFFEVMQDKDCGKKLGFIAQEMGREINTMGAKANHSKIQELVVLMKDDLEKIKEQTNNVL